MQTALGQFLGTIKQMIMDNWQVSVMAGAAVAGVVVTLITCWGIFKYLAWRT